MASLPEKALERVGGLPADEQDSMALQILDSLADEDAWKERFGGEAGCLETACARGAGGG
jgi:hypothetical protein